MLKDLTFTLQDEKYVSDPVQLPSDAGLHLEFEPVLHGNCVNLEQSITGDKYYNFKTEFGPGAIYDLAISGVVPGMYIRIKTVLQPTVAKILVSE